MAFDLRPHMTIGSTLFRVLARRFNVIGRRNDVVAGRYFKTLFNAHPNPIIHMNNFILRPTKEGFTQLQLSLGIPALQRYSDHSENEVSSQPPEHLSAIYLLRVLNCVQVEHLQMPSGDSSEHSKLPEVEKFDSGQHEEQQQPNDDDSGRKRSRRQRKDLCKKIDTLQQSVQGISAIVKNLICQPESDVLVDNNTEKCSTPTPEPEPEKVVPVKATSSGVNPKRNSRRESVSSVVSEQSLISTSSSQSPVKKKKKKAKTQFEQGQKVTSAMLNSFARADFGDLSHRPHDLESYNDYDSDYFEKNRDCK